jgi:CRISPR/Cas system-associated exonuclease Cas4 (RecB family)
MLILSKHNHHSRDENIKFEEQGHIYTILNDAHTKYTSVTTWNHSHFPHFDADKTIKNMMNSKQWKEGYKYWGLTAQEIKNMWEQNGKNASGLGTSLHYDIECFMNNNTLKKNYTHVDLLSHNNILCKEEPKEWKHFMNFLKDSPHMKPYRTEWMIYDEELKLAGSIDMVYENEDGTLSIYDWKRCKDISKINTFNKYAIPPTISHMFDSNFWHYSLQLNTYKAILEKNYGKIITTLCLVQLHPDKENYELHYLPILREEINTLFELRKKQLQP